MVKSILPAAGLILALTGQSWAQSQAPTILQNQQQPGSPVQVEESARQGEPSAAGEILPEEQESHIRAEKLIGMPVVNTAQEELGTVEDIVFDDQGRVEGLVLSTGGFLGFGRKAIGISWNDVESVKGADSLILDMSKDKLAAAPQFKTKEDKAREAEAAAQRQEQGQENPPLPTPQR